MNIPADLKYTESHEWVRAETDGTFTVGITEYAQDALGDIVFVELPQVGKTFTAGADAAVVESVKAASDIYAPVAGEVVSRNEALDTDSALINSDPYGEGWLLEIKLAEADAVESLLSASEYEQQVG